MSDGPSNDGAPGAGRSESAPPSLQGAAARGHSGAKLTHVCLVRHGEVAAAHKGRLYGGTEVPLSEHGVQASLLLAAELARGAPERVYSSPLSRAALLAQALAEHSGAPLVLDPAFREMHRGLWTHLTKAEVEARWPGALALSIADPEQHAAPEGERESAFTARVHEALERVLAADAGRRVVVVTHAHVVRVIMRRLLGWDAPTSMSRFVPYHGVVELAFDGSGAGRVLSAPPGITQDALIHR